MCIYWFGRTARRFEILHIVVSINSSAQQRTMMAGLGWRRAGESGWQIIVSVNWANLDVFSLMLIEQTGQGFRILDVVVCHWKLSGKRTEMRAHHTWAAFWTALNRRTISNASTTQLKPLATINPLLDSTSERSAHHWKPFIQLQSKSSRVLNDRARTLHSDFGDLNWSRFWGLPLYEENICRWERLVYVREGFNFRVTITFFVQPFALLSRLKQSIRASAALTSPIKLIR